MFGLNHEDVELVLIALRYLREEAVDSNGEVRAFSGCIPVANTGLSRFVGLIDRIERHQRDHAPLVGCHAFPLPANAENEDAF